MGGAAVEPARAEHRPPSVVPEDGLAATRPEEELRLDARGQNSEEAAHPDTAAGEHELEAEEDDAGADHEWDEAEVAPERTQRRSEAPHPRVPPPAVVAGIVVDSAEHAARRANHGA